MPRAERAEVGGVPVLWKDFGEDLPIATIMFRVGVADETLQTRGLTHLIEHMALSIGHQRFDYNGFVDDTRTVLTARGTREELKSFLEGVTGNLNSPQLDSLATNARVLRTESAGRQDGWLAYLKDARFGARSYGLSNYRELGLHWLGPDEVLEWSTSRFTAQNAVIWMTCPPPEGLSLALPAGQRIPPPAPRPSPLPLPLYLTWESFQIAITFLMDIARPTIAGFRVLEHVVESELRHQRGLSYHVEYAAELLTADSMHALFTADCLQETALQVRDGMLAAIDRLATRGPSEEEMRWMVQACKDQFRGADTDPTWLEAESSDELVGRDFLPAEEVIEIYRSVSAKEIAEGLSSALDTAMMLAPLQLGPPPGWRTVPKRLARTVAGKSFTAAKEVEERERGAQLSVGSEGVSARLRDGTVFTVLFDECAGIGWYSDGRRILFELGGSTMLIDPNRWTKGSEAVALIDAAVSAELFVPMEGAAPGARTPPSAGEAPSQQPSRRRWSLRKA